MQLIVHQTIEETSKQLSRPSSNVLQLMDMIAGVFQNIKERGDEALLEYSQQYDKQSFSDSMEMQVSSQEFLESSTLVSSELKSAIEIAKKNIEKFHSAQQKSSIEIETSAGVICKRKSHPIEKIGLYIPGGTAPLFSTVLMLAIPAKIAGCKEVVLCTPPNKNGKVHPAILFAAQLCGVSNIYKIGGSQAIAAMTHGTETIPEVYKIFGPGNSYVTAAKQYASVLGKAIDMPAGPSEVMVIADQFANPKIVAADLLSQAEHGVDSHVVLVSWDKEILIKSSEQAYILAQSLGREKMIKETLSKSKLVHVEFPEDALDICNTYAPEHLILQLSETDFFEENVRNCGSVFVGYNTPESAGDYASGTNHTLPTSGFAKQFSGVSLDSFLRHTTYQKITEEGLRELGNKSIIPMAKAEGLDAHALAVELRINSFL